MKKAETQEQEFLEVCSSYDYDLLTGKREMTLKDYERITYLVSSLGYSQYDARIKTVSVKCES